MSAAECDELTAEVERISAPVAEGGEAFDRAAWQRLERAGYTLVSVPAAAGGSGGTLAHSAAVVRGAGRTGAGVPLVETMWGAGWLLAGAGAAVPAGPLSAAAFEPGAVLVPDSGGWQVRGVLRRVPWAAAAELIVGLLPDDTGHRLVLLRPGSAAIRAGSNLAGEPRNDVVCAGVALAEADVVIPAAEASPSALETRYALGRVLAMAGAAERALALAVRYAGEREQFGRPIGRFQAVQQLLAGLAAETTALVVAGQAAVTAMELGGADAAAFAVAAAKASASRSAGVVAAAAHQVLGALGFTREHPLHRSTTRLWAWRDEPYTERRAHLELASRVLGADAWELITG